MVEWHLSQICNPLEILYTYIDKYVLSDKYQFESVFISAGTIIRLPYLFFGTKIAALKTYAREKQSYFFILKIFQ